MKKIAVLIFAVLLTFTACSGGNDTNKKSSGFSSSSSAVPDIINDENSRILPYDEEVESSVDETSYTDGKLLMKSFGELWMGDAYYIDVLMTQEYDPSKMNSGSSAESSGGIQTIKYDYIIAVDFENDIGGLIMISDVGNKCSLVKNHEIYTIDHKNKTYTKELYDGLAENLGEEFTLKRCLGIINNCTFVEKGDTTYKDAEVQYEKYTIKSQMPGVSDPTITYYFDSTGKPLAEIVETESGKTTFEFRVVSNKIESSEILKIPDDYKEIAS